MTFPFHSPVVIRSGGLLQHDKEWPLTMPSRYSDLYYDGTIPIRLFLKRDLAWHFPPVNPMQQACG